MKVAFERYPRRLVRLVTITALASTALALATPVANATPHLRTTQHRAPDRARVFRSITGHELPGSNPHVAGARGTRARWVYLTFPIPGSPYRFMQLLASETTDGNRVTFATFRTDDATVSNQFFERGFRVPRGTVDIANDLSHVSIHTGSALGSIGSVDLDLSTGTPAHSTTFHCRATGEPTSTRRYRRVGMQGAVSLSLGIANIPDPLTTTTARGAAQRITYTGARCPRRRQCYPSAWFGAWNAPTQTDLSASKHLEEIDLIDFDIRWRITSIDWFTSTTSTTTPVTIGHDSVTIDGDIASPFLDGSITFARAGPTRERARPPCRYITSKFAWSSGSLDVLWDTGTESLAGPWRGVHLYRWRRP